MNEYEAQFLTIVVVHLFAVAAPGPDFTIVVKNSVSHGRKIAMITSIGVGLGILIHVTYSLLGIGLIISQSIVAFNIMKYIGAVYLFYIGFKSIMTKSTGKSCDMDKMEVRSISFKKALFTGFMTNGLNPKATLFFLALFTAIIKPHTPKSYQLAYGIYMSIATMTWFCFISLIFGHPIVRKVFQRVGIWFDRIMGGLLIALGLKLALSELD